MTVKTGVCTQLELEEVSTHKSAITHAAEMSSWLSMQLASILRYIWRPKLPL